MAVIPETNLAMIRGDTLAFGVEIEGLDQELDTAYFSCKASMEDQEYVFQKKLDDGITLAEIGKYRVRVAPEDTRNLEPKSYVYDLQISVNGDVFTVMIGQLAIFDDVTRRE